MLTALSGCRPDRLGRGPDSFPASSTYSQRHSDKMEVASSSARKFKVKPYVSFWGRHPELELYGRVALCYARAQGNGGHQWMMSHGTRQ